MSQHHHHATRYQSSDNKSSSSVTVQSIAARQAAIKAGAKNHAIDLTSTPMYLDADDDDEAEATHTAIKRKAETYLDYKAALSNNKSLAVNTKMSGEKTKPQNSANTVKPTNTPITQLPATNSPHIEPKIKRKKHKNEENEVNNAIAVQTPSIIRPSSQINSNHFYTSESLAEAKEEGETMFYNTILRWSINAPAVAAQISRRQPTSDQNSSFLTSLISDARAKPSAASTAPLKSDSTDSQSKQYNSEDDCVSFSSVEQYKSFFQPLLLDDFRSQLQQSADLNSTSAQFSLSQLALVRFYPEELHFGRVSGAFAMYRIELLPREDMEKGPATSITKNLRAWNNGDITLLQFYGHNHGQNPLQILCLIEKIEIYHDRIGNSAPFCIKLRVFLPGAAAAASRIADNANPHRFQQFFSIFHALHSAINEVEDEKQPKPSRSQKINLQHDFALIQLDSPITTLREYLALLSVDKLRLLPQLTDPNSSPTAQKINKTNEEAFASSWRALPEKFSTHLQQDLNEFQLYAVKLAVYQSNLPGFTLLQGPPGTGQLQTSQLFRPISAVKLQF
jgi:hypothetical protein